MTSVTTFGQESGSVSEMNPRDLEFQRYAAQHHGIVSLGELLALGMTYRTVKHRLASGFLVKVHPRVFRVAGSPASRFSMWRAAVLYGGEGAMLRGRSAGAALGLDGVIEPHLVEVAVRSGRRRKVSTLIDLRPGTIQERSTSRASQ